MEKTDKSRIVEALENSRILWGYSEGNKIVLDRVILEFYADESLQRAYGDYEGGG